MVQLGYTDRAFSGTVTSNGNTYDTPVTTQYVKEAIIFLEVTDLSGWLDIELHTWNPETGEWHLLAKFDRITALGNDEGFIEYGLGQRIAVSYEISDSATFSVDIHMK